MKQFRLALVAPFTLVVVGCFSPGPEFPADGTLLLYDRPLEVEPYRIAPGDGLGLRFAYHVERNTDVAVRPDGKISIPFAEEVHAAGKTVAELDAELTVALARHYKHPDVAVMVMTFAPQRAFVGGEVNQPGDVELRTGLTVMQALAARGWFKTTAATDSVVLIRGAGPGRRVVKKLDLSPANIAKNDVPLRPFDILYAPQRSIVRVGEWVDQNINALVPRMLSFGAYYNLNEIKFQ